MAFLSVATELNSKNTAVFKRYPLFQFRPCFLAVASFCLRPKTMLSYSSTIPNMLGPAHQESSLPSFDVASLVWFRKDLRIHDHEPLWRAAFGRHDPIQSTADFEQTAPQVSPPTEFPMTSYSKPPHQHRPSRPPSFWGAWHSPSPQPHEHHAGSRSQHHAGT